MAITSAICTSFKQELLVGTHNFTATSGNSFKLALYTSSATLGAGTTAFTTTGQASGRADQSTGGQLFPTTYFFNATLTKTNFVAVNPTTFI